MLHKIKHSFYLLLCILGIGFTFSPVGYSQMDIDSLQNVLDHSATDSSTLRNYLYQAEQLDGSNTEAAIIICKWVLTQNKKKPIQIIACIAYYVMGRSYFIIDAFDESANNYTKALYIADKYQFNHLKSAIYTGIANVYDYNKQVKLSKEYYLKAISFAQAEHDTNGLISSYINIASYIVQTKESANSIKEALHYLDLADALNEYAGIQDYFVFTLNLRGVFYLETIQYDSAIVFLNEAEQLINKYQLPEYLPFNYRITGEYYVKKSQYPSAIATFLKAIEVSNKINNSTEVYYAYEQISTTYATMGDYKKAYEYHKLYKEAYDSITNSSTTLKLNNNITQYNLNKKENELNEANIETGYTQELLNKEKAIKKYVILTLILFFLIAIILIVVAIVLKKSVNAKKLAYRKLQEKNIEIQHQSELLVKLTKEITKYQTQMNPHFIFNALNSIQGLVVNNEKQKTLDNLQKFSKLMRQTLNNSDAETISLEKEIEYLTLYINFEQGRFNNELGFIIDAPLDLEDVLIPPMMIQPFIENSLKHAGLNDIEKAEIKLSIEEEGELLKITIADNGKGFSKSKADIIQNSHAIAIVKSRIKLVFDNEGKPFKENYFTILSVPDIKTGTIVIIYLPLITKF